MWRFRKLVIRQSEKINFSYNADRAVPNEICGVLTGPVSNDLGRVTKIHLVENISELIPQTHFIMNPQGFYDVLKQTNWIDESLTDTFLGIIHSHPNDNFWPSHWDKAAARDGKVNEGAYIIYSARDAAMNVMYMYDRTYHQLDWFYEEN
jgi:proteasome lid subunit RPN8/RPN11